jgi:rhodanese-related sulfurtransferase
VNKIDNVSIDCKSRPLERVEEDRDVSSRIDEILAAARARLERVTAEEAAVRQAAGALLVDTRPEAQRRRDGEIPGALLIERNVLEWRLDPASDARIAETHAECEVIVVCNEGYSSSLAAASLQDCGLPRATDMIGGFQAWRDAGLPVRSVR